MFKNYTLILGELQARQAALSGGDPGYDDSIIDQKPLADIGDSGRDDLIMGKKPLADVGELINVLERGKPSDDDFNNIAHCLKVFDPGNVVTIYEEWKKDYAAWQSSFTAKLFGVPAPVCPLISSLKKVKDQVEQKFDGDQINFNRHG